MKTGTKSLLFGVHQFLWHPITVWLAWRKLYGRPTWRECVCIFIHDWGYWGSPDMDGEYGSKHPIRSALIALRFGFGPEEYTEILNHSRSLSFVLGHTPSRLCWADKYSMLFDPAWFYLLRARLSGEIHEYRRNAAKSGFIGLAATDGEWLQKLKTYLSRMAKDAAKPALLFIVVLVATFGYPVPVTAGEHTASAVVLPGHTFDADAFLQAVRSVENWQGRRGAAGEIGPWQMMPATWAVYRGDARERAQLHLAWLQRELSRRSVAPLPFNLALCWNAGLAATVSGRAPVSSYQYAARVAALIQ